MSNMKCKRCGTDEDRIKGFCSMECKDAWYYEDEIKELKAENKRLREFLESFKPDQDCLNDLDAVWHIYKQEFKS